MSSGTTHTRVPPEPQSTWARPLSLRFRPTQGLGLSEQRLPIAAPVSAASFRNEEELLAAVRLRENGRRRTGALTGAWSPRAPDFGSFQTHSPLVSTSRPHSPAQRTTRPTPTHPFPPGQVPGWSLGTFWC